MLPNENHCAYCDDDDGTRTETNTHTQILGTDLRSRVLVDDFYFLHSGSICVLRKMTILLSMGSRFANDRCFSGDEDLCVLYFREEVVGLG